MKQEIIGISGTSASGKDLAAAHLESQGYLHVSTADIVRDESIRLYGSTDQYDLRAAAGAIRRREGPGAIALKALLRFEALRNEYGGLVVSGIRAVAPAQAIKDTGGFLMFFDAPSRLRYERQNTRGRTGESTSFEEFVRFENEEMEGALNTGQNLGAVKAMSDLVIYNDSDKSSFISRIETAAGLA